MKPDPLDIPAFLLVKNRKPMTPEQHAALVVKRAEQPPQEFSLNRPRHLDPEGEAMLAALNAPKRTRLVRDGIVASIERKDTSPRPSRDGLTTIAELAKEQDMLPRVARGLLRLHGMPKPEVGWAFNAEQAERARAILRAGPDAAKPKGDTTTPARKQRTTKRLKRSRVPAGAGARREVTFTGKATVTRPPPPTLAVHANIFEAKHASRIKEIAPCPTPSKKSSTRSKSSSKTRSASSKKKTTASPPSKRRSVSPSRSSRRSTKTRSKKHS